MRCCLACSHIATSDTKVRFQLLSGADLKHKLKLLIKVRMVMSSNVSTTHPIFFRTRAPKPPAVAVKIDEAVFVVGHL